MFLSRRENTLLTTQFPSSMHISLTFPGWWSVVGVSSESVLSCFLSVSERFQRYSIAFRARRLKNSFVSMTSARRGKGPFFRTGAILFTQVVSKESWKILVFKKGCPLPHLFFFFQGSMSHYIFLYIQFFPC